MPRSDGVTSPGGAFGLLPSRGSPQSRRAEHQRLCRSDATTAVHPIAESGEGMAELAAEPGQAGLPTREEAEQNYNEAVGEAVEACAADTAGQRCYICLDGAAGEGLVRGCSCRGASGVAHVSCLARGAQAAVERDADTGMARWHSCGLCKQQYHGVVRCALGWACWKTYVGRPETDWAWRDAMNLLGCGLSAANHHEDALSVREAALAMKRRLGAPEHSILSAQSNLAITYSTIGRFEEALQIKRDVYSGRLELNGEEHEETLLAANNYANTLGDLQRYEEAKALLRKTMPVAQRVLGEGRGLALKMRWNYAKSLYRDDGATFDDLREAVTTLEDVVRIARQVSGGAHPTTTSSEKSLRKARATLRAREAPDDDETVDVPAQEDDADDIAAAPSEPSRPPTPATPASPAMPPPPVDAPPACFSCW